MLDAKGKTSELRSWACKKNLKNLPSQETLVEKKSRFAKPLDGGGGHPFKGKVAVGRKGRSSIRDSSGVARGKRRVDDRETRTLKQFLAK